MLKIGVIDEGRAGAAEKLLHNLAADAPIEICCGGCGNLDVLVVNKTPDGHMPPPLLSPRVVVANSDDMQVLQFVSRLGGRIITYGLNPKAAITVSSHADDNCVICVQRAMATIHGAPLLPQEFSVNIKGHEGFDRIILGVVAAALVCGAKFGPQ